MTARSSILDRVRIALANREVVAHPGSFEGWRPVMHSGDPTEQFTEMFEKAGGEVVSFTAQAEASLWVRGFLADFDSLSVGELARRLQARVICCSEKQELMVETLTLRLFTSG